MYFLSAATVLIKEAPKYTHTHTSSGRRVKLRRRVISDELKFPFFSPSLYYVFNTRHHSSALSQLPQQFSPSSLCRQAWDLIEKASGIVCGESFGWVINTLCYLLFLLFEGEFYWYRLIAGKVEKEKKESSKLCRCSFSSSASPFSFSSAAVVFCWSAERSSDDASQQQHWVSGKSCEDFYDLLFSLVLVFFTLFFSMVL